ncbi:MAG: NAD(P)H-hydrate epimerase, partial [Gemmobacter sp.]|nr:NAD(P)H-hydrate epimerase [Gemmobacter sp.]
MTDLLTAAQMRAIERAAIDSGMVTGLDLMERAGQGVVDAVFTEWPDLARGGEERSLRAVVLCGPGNNGGDGFVVARLLRARGWEVHVLVYGDPARLPPDAAENYRRWCDMGGVHVVPPGDEGDHTGWLEAAIYAQAQFDPAMMHLAERAPHAMKYSGDLLLVDALFGTGLSHPLGDAGYLTQDFGFLDDYLYDIAFHTVAIDIPSGICADSGRVLGEGGAGRPFGAVTADLTVTFHRPKLGHVLNVAADGCCGKLAVVDIGLEEVPQPDGIVFSTAWPARLSKRAGHKYSHGHALILSGPPGRCGAARLAARGALRIGAGVVTLACPPEAMAENAARLDAVMLRPLTDAAGLRALLEDERINALCLGPGLGLDAREAGLVAEALQSGRPVVLDADALTL